MAFAIDIDIEMGELVVWLVLGVLAGSFAGALVTRKGAGFGLVTNLLFGLAGALVGGVLFDALDVELDLGSVTLQYDRLVAAFVGALIVIVVARFLESRRQKSDQQG